MKKTLKLTLLTLALLSAMLNAKNNNTASLHQSLITLDSHVDISREYMQKAAFDPALNTNMKVDFSKMIKGGLDAVVFVVYVAQKERNAEGYKAAYQAAKNKFNAIHKMTDEFHKSKIKLALRASDVKAITGSKKLVAIIGIENGFVIGKDLNKLVEFYHLGARYMGLTHSGHNDICNSSGINKQLGDTATPDKGLSSFGEKVILKMNSLGMMVDISHASDQCIRDALRVSKAPIIASHSGARALLDHPRNLPDDLIKAIAEKGGVVQLVGYSGFLKNDPARNKAYAEIKKEIAKLYKVEKFNYKDHEHTSEYANGMIQLNKDFPLASVKNFVDQIEHAIKIAGINHVGISSDFDGGGELQGWKDASESANITKELLARGYNKIQIQKIWSGNFLHSWQSVERLSESNQ